LIQAGGVIKAFRSSVPLGGTERGDGKYHGQPHHARFAKQELKVKGEAHVQFQRRRPQGP
jgi:hypothetical protein